MKLSTPWPGPVDVGEAGGDHRIAAAVEVEGILSIKFTGTQQKLHARVTKGIAAVHLAFAHGVAGDARPVQVVIAGVLQRDAADLLASDPHMTVVQRDRIAC